MILRGTMDINSRGHLEIGGCDTEELAQRFGTPLYVLDEDLLRQNCRAYHGAFASPGRGGLVVYAAKAFLSLAMCRIIAEEGLGLDVVSGGELHCALEAGFPADMIYFHGNNKSPRELAMALEAGVGRIVIDNMAELEMLNLLSLQAGRVQECLIRVTPGIEAHTHDYIKTGQTDSKFGFPLPQGQALEAAVAACRAPGLKLVGMHCHIGSQVFELEPYIEAVRVMLGFFQEVETRTGLSMLELDLGGGLGIYYAPGDTPPSVADYATAIFDTLEEECRRLKRSRPRVVVEPGRSIIGPVGTTLYTVGSTKDIPGVRKYVAVDGGMSDNIRPALYRASYEVMLANKAGWPEQEVVSITGKLCESGDMLAWDVDLPVAEPGDILAMPATGAYCYAMASNYNRLGRPAVVLVRQGTADLIVRCESYQDMLRNEVLPERLQSEKIAMASLR